MLVAFVNSLVTQCPSHLGGFFLETFVCRIIIKFIVIVSHWGILLARVDSVNKVIFSMHFSKEMFLCSCRSLVCSRFDGFFGVLCLSYYLNTLTEFFCIFSSLSSCQTTIIVVWFCIGCVHYSE